jgi:putative transposase
MKKSRFTESQIVAILKEGEAGVAVAQITRKHGISPATYQRSIISITSVRRSDFLVRRVHEPMSPIRGAMERPS